jgi:hypothetical protein
LTCVTVDLSQPLLHVVEWYFVCYIVNNDNSVCSSVVAACDGSEALLSCCIPNLQLNSLSIDIECSDFLVSKREHNCAINRQQVRSRQWYRMFQERLTVGVTNNKQTSYYNNKYLQSLHQLC